MKLLILEDEEPAATRLKKLIKEIDSTIEIVEIIESVQSGITFFKNNAQPDAVISDIQLSDGISFEIFKNNNIKCPVIFTTAYDQYAIEAFKANGIDYILKPVNREELKTAIEKSKRFAFESHKNEAKNLDDVIKHLDKKLKNYQKRIIIRFGDTIKTVEINEVAYFYTQNKIEYLRTKAGIDYPVDYHLDDLESVLDPQLFFRINRQFIIAFSAIEKMATVSKSRVKLILKPPSTDETIVSTERSPVFKEWLTGKGE